MILQIKKPLLFFDTETTGVDPAKDRIISLSFACFLPSGAVVKRDYKFNPGIPIPADATAIHGIKNEDVEFEDEFQTSGHAIFKAFDGSDLAGYNLLDFDIPILWEEFHRCNIAWDLSKVAVIDACNIFKKKEPRNLENAIRFFCGREHESAHTADGDVSATIDVLDAQISRYGFDPADLSKLAELSRYDNRIDLAGKLVRNEKGEAVYNIGKAKGKRVVDDPGFGRWMLKQEFTQETKQHLYKLVGGPV